MPPHELGPQQVLQERPSGASRMLENLLAAGTPPRTSLGELTAHPQTPGWWGAAGCALPRTSSPLSQHVVNLVRQQWTLNVIS